MEGRGGTEGLASPTVGKGADEWARDFCGEADRQPNIDELTSGTRAPV